MGKVTVYSSENCINCRTVMKRFDSKGVEYAKQMLEDHPEIAALARGKGFMALPVMSFETTSGTDVVAGPTACLEKMNELSSVSA